MSDVPTKAKRFPQLRKAKADAQEQAWSLQCLCGKETAGLRQEVDQKIACSNCERLHFILPINTYPEPKRIKKKRKKKKREPFQKVAVRKIRQASKAIRSSSRKVANVAAVRTKRRTVATYTSVKKWFTRLRITIILLMVILGLAGFFGYRKQVQNTALHTLREAIVAGDHAIKEKQWGEATEQYQRAAEAIGLLGRTDTFAQQILQKNRELQAIDGLCTLSLNEIIESAAGKGRTTLDWETEFKTAIKNRWLVLESWVDLGATENSSEAIFTHSMSMGTQSVNFILPADLFSFSENISSHHTLYAGQIETVERSKDPRFDWVIKMRSDSSFLWCFEETTPPLRFELDSQWFPKDSLRQVLKHQREHFLEGFDEEQKKGKKK